ncbi:dTDP-4-dehydrorhamnose reductase family protein [Mariprofundus ferrooxydans]|uniref:dTDP-4-dehydrorhamnose reductase family protein n=1 Tax=Mariprofundus ferrooxydans TaxID=314344 RepID=UPI001431B820|nr:SDR family oxidoreductase [Mariprofundus ferrooxydans]
MNILILGASGMLGNAMIRVLSEHTDWHVYGTARSEAAKRYFHADIAELIISGVDVEQSDSLMQAFIRSRPDVVINCIGLVKQLADASDPLHAVPINTLLPHRLARMCELVGARLVHMSTDCVFSGDKGGYVESDDSDAKDLYGKSKFLGEVDYPHAITLRTSIIGHELQSAHGLVGWFLSQKGQCKGFTRAVFSGFPTVVLAQIIRDVVIPHSDLHGVYHVAANPISKYDLIGLVARVYGKQIEIVPDDGLILDRSLDASRFKSATGYIAPEWPELIETMHAYQQEAISYV